MRFPCLLLLLASSIGCATSIDDPSSESIRFDGGSKVDTGTAADPDSEVVDSSTAKPDTGTIDTGTSTTDTGSTPIDTGTTPIDTGTTPTDTGVVDTGPEDTGTVTTSADITFPATGDTKVISKDPYMWTSGDSIEGARTTTLPSATSISGTWNITNSIGTCGLFGTTTGKVNVDVSINGTKVGSLVIKSGTGSAVPISFTFGAITGPTYTIKYQLTATVASGCGQIESSWDTSKLTLK